jgi:hypothetical protein
MSIDLPGANHMGTPVGGNGTPTLTNRSPHGTVSFSSILPRRLRFTYTFARRSEEWTVRYPSLRCFRSSENSSAGDGSALGAELAEGAAAGSGSGGDWAAASSGTAASGVGDAAFTDGACPPEKASFAMEAARPNVKPTQATSEYRRHGVRARSRLTGDDRCRKPIQTLPESGLASLTDGGDSGASDTRGIFGAGGITTGGSPSGLACADEAGVVLTGGGASSGGGSG